jgi:hypothetical protein
MQKKINILGRNCISSAISLDTLSMKMISYSESYITFASFPDLVPNKGRV